MMQHIFHCYYNTAFAELLLITVCCEHLNQSRYQRWLNDLGIIATFLITFDNRSCKACFFSKRASTAIFPDLDPEGSVCQTPGSGFFFHTQRGIYAGEAHTLTIVLFFLDNFFFFRSSYFFKTILNITHTNSHVGSMDALNSE